MLNKEVQMNKIFVLLVFILAVSGCIKKTGEAFEFSADEEHTIYNLLDGLDPSQIYLVLNTDEESADVIDAISEMAGHYELPDFLEDSDAGAEPSNGNRLYFSSYNNNVYTNAHVDILMNSIWDFGENVAVIKLFEDGVINVAVITDTDAALVNAINVLKQDIIDDKLKFDCVVINNSVIFECGTEPPALPQQPSGGSGGGGGGGGGASRRSTTAEEVEEAPQKKPLEVFYSPEKEEEIVQLVEAPADKINYKYQIISIVLILSILIIAGFIIFKRKHHIKKPLKNKKSLNIIKDYIQKCLDKGFKLKDIRKALIKKKWPKTLINNAIKGVRK